MGRSSAEKKAESQENQLMQQQQKLEAQQQQQEKEQKQELLKRKLAAIRGAQGANSLGGPSNPGSTSGGLSDTIG